MSSYFRAQKKKEVTFAGYFLKLYQSALPTGSVGKKAKR